MDENLRVCRPEDADRWDAFLMAHPLGRCRHAWAGDAWWEAMGCRIIRLGIWRGDSLRAGAVVRIRKPGWSPFSIARIEALMPDPEDVPGTAPRLVQGIQRLARKALSVEIDNLSWIPCTFETGGVAFGPAVEAALRDAGFTLAGEPRGTYFVRIDLDDEALLATFSSRARRNIRKAQRDGATVRELHGREELAVFVEAYNGMLERKDLKHLSPLPLEATQALFERGHFLLFGAEFQGRLRNLSLVDPYGVPQCTLSALLPAAFEEGVPNTGQMTHFEIMRAMRERGAAWYDLGGSPGPEPVEGHPNLSIWRLKHEFSGPYVECLPRQRLASCGPLGRLALALGRKILRVGA